MGDAGRAKQAKTSHAKRGGKPLTQKEAENLHYVFRDAQDEKVHREKWEELERIQDWKDIPELYAPLQDNICLSLQKQIDSDGGIIDRVGSARPKQVLYCRMYMHLNRLAMRQLQSTIKRDNENEGDENQGEDHAHH